MEVEKNYNFRRVSDRVTTSGVVGAERLSGLSEAGYEAVINLLPDSSEYAVAGEADMVTEQGIEYVYIPVDFAAPAHEEFESFCSAMDALEDRTVHIHCAANFRVSAFYSLYAMRRGWWNAEQADRHMKDLWNPDAEAAWSQFIRRERARLQD